ncbi:prefoldin subunit 3 [Gamsiella multidivaricata]|uniref:prefoldin subunit 3 n=1 Tax=Gamsiella multidivaricata TaxID=101098 RepID=UPI00221E6F99|nr:prefoldin subunit 3 [Gamsiella multidivaricata]KAG0361265.1 peptide chain release factor 1 [Gamsiella multidivaricata]KAI7830469.1 prefoldin subunit 3 [Gamsiella multidivaricata]
METNPRGIPKAPFVENVEDHVTEQEPVEIVLRKFQEAVAKYKFMEVNMLQRKRNLDAKIPEIRKTLEMVQFLQSQAEEDEDKEIETLYELNDTLYATAKVMPTGKVCLWLGANVMLEYPVGEAAELLASKLEAALKTLKNTEEDLVYLRDQITTMEVNTARVYNWDVKQRRLARVKAEAAGEE